MTSVDNASSRQYRLSIATERERKGGSAIDTCANNKQNDKLTSHALRISLSLRTLVGETTLSRRYIQTIASRAHRSCSLKKKLSTLVKAAIESGIISSDLRCYRYGKMQSRALVDRATRPAIITSQALKMIFARGVRNQ